MRLSGGWLSEPLDCADFLLGGSPPKNDIRRLSDLELWELSPERVDSFSLPGKLMEGVLASGEVGAAAAAASTGEVML